MNWLRRVTDFLTPPSTSGTATTVSSNSSTTTTLAVAQDLDGVEIDVLNANAAQERLPLRVNG